MPGPQTLLLSCPIEDVFYGGARFGGKTDGLLGDFAVHANEYAEHARGILFRRTYTELDEVIIRSRELYTKLAWGYTDNDHTWTAPNGATLKLRYLETDADADRYQGHQYCVDANAPVLLADGSWCPIGDVGVGEIVATLEGPQRVTNRVPPYLAECVRADVYDGDGVFRGNQLQPIWHPVLTSLGWLSFLDAVAVRAILHSPTLSQRPRRLDEPSLGTTGRWPLSVWGHGRPLVPFRQLQGLGTWQTDVWPGGGVTETQRVADSPVDCLLSFRSDGGLLLDRPDIGPGIAPSLVGVASPCRGDWLQDGLGNIPARTQTGGRWYAHPYTSMHRPLVEQIELGACVFTPCGSQWVADITVANANHYITQSSLINKNTWMAFDEAQQWPRSDPIDKLWGSLRSPYGVPCVRRLTGNPPAPLWLKNRYIDAAPPLTPFRYASNPKYPHLTIEAVYIPASIDDNLLAKNDPQYEARLAAAGSDDLYRAWRFGDWNAMVGAVFKEWRPHLHILGDAFTAPVNWRWAAGLDWGYRGASWFGWFASSAEGDVVNMDELVFRETTAYDAGFATGTRCRTYPSLEYIAADEQMWYKTGTSAPALWEEFQKGLLDAYGGDIESCPKLRQATHGRGSRLTKLEVTHRYLRWKAGPDGKTVQPWDRPRLRIVAKCKYLIQTLPALQYDPSKARGNDVDTDSEDHGYDGLTAYLMSRPPIAEKLHRRPDVEQHPGFEGKRRKKQWEQGAQDYERSLSGFAPPRFQVPRELEEIE